MTQEEIELHRDIERMCKTMRGETYESSLREHANICKVIRNRLIQMGRTGPWTHTEGDYTFVRDNNAPWTGIIYRNPITFTLNGYIGLPPGHKHWGKTYGDIDDEVPVHCGFTYASEDDNLIRAKEGNHWWLGFDTAHSYDYMPLMPVASNPSQYKTEVWVRNQIIQIARELFKGNWKAATFTDLLRDL